MPPRHHDDVHDHGVASRTFTYDRWAQRTEERRFDTSGAPAGVKGVARKESVYDDIGRVVERIGRRAEPGASGGD